MEETELPLEKLHEDMEHAAHHGGKNWLTWAALLSAILAVLGAIGALSSGHHANEAMLEQLKASDSWNYFQATSVKTAVLETRKQILEALGKQAEVGDKLDKYSNQKDELQEKAEELEHQSELHFHKHEQFAQSVTMFQIAIAVTAIAVLAGKRRFLFASIAFGIVGAGFLVQGFLTST